MRALYAPLYMNKSAVKYKLSGMIRLLGQSIRIRDVMNCLFIFRLVGEDNLKITVCSQRPYLLKIGGGVRIIKLMRLIAHLQNLIS